MLKDIPQHIVEGIGIAVVGDGTGKEQENWNVYLLNFRKELIEGVLVTSKGFGMIEGDEVKTSTLRHSLGSVEPETYTKIEPIISNLFGLNNEYWVSFFLNGVMYDRKFIFLPGTISEENFIKVPLINKRGVMIR